MCVSVFVYVRASVCECVCVVRDMKRQAGRSNSSAP